MRVNTTSRSGRIEYRLTVLGPDTNADGQLDPIDLTSVGGNNQGQITGNIEIKRGGQSLPAKPDNVVTFNTTAVTYNSFGEVIAKIINGSSQEYFEYDQRNSSGEMVLEIEGTEEDIEQGLQWLREKGLDIELAECDVIE